MRPHLALMIALAGCGRLGFGDAPPPDAPPSARPAVCNASALYDTAGQITGQTVTDVRVAPFAGGYALGIGTSALNLYALHLDANLVPTESTPHLPLAGAYTLWSAFATPSYAFFFVGDTDGTAYIKRLENNFDSYSAIQNVGKYPSDPTVVPLGTQYLFGAIDTTGALAMYTIDAAGNTGTISVAYHPAASSVSLAPVAGGVEVAIAGSPCTTFVVDPSGATTAPATFATSCTAPFISGDYVVYESSGQIILHAISTGVETTLGTGHAPRLALGTSVWATWITASGELAIANTADTTVSTLPASSLDLVATSSGVESIWLDGTVVRHGTACLR